MHWSKIALVLAPEDPYAPYYAEALQGAGVPHTVWEGFDPGRLGEATVVLLCGYGTLGPSA
ncbi:MAG TPA: hypothetical protein DER07_00670, partial [Armatimonadetes bacterium]|nr:hypothetical protein [Armatimonadota bacterium]